MVKIRRERQKFHISTTPSNSSTIVAEAPKYKPVPVEYQPSDNVFAGINIDFNSLAKLSEGEEPTLPSKVESKSQHDNVKANKNEKVNKNGASIESKKPVQPEKQLSKKEKLKLKHEKLLAKIDVIQQAKQRINNKRQKKQTDTKPKSTPLTLITKEAIKLKDENRYNGETKQKFGDLKTVKDALLDLKDALPALDSIYKYKAMNAKTGLETKSITEKSKQAMVEKSSPVKKGPKGIQKNKKKSKKRSNQFAKNCDYFRKLLADKTYKENPRAVIALHIKNKLRAQKEKI